MKSAIFTLFYFLTCCAHHEAKVVFSDEKTHVIKFPSGSNDFSKPWYDSFFEKKASEICSEGFVILEKSHHPKNISMCEAFINRNDFFWVIECKDSILK